MLPTIVNLRDESPLFTLLSNQREKVFSVYSYTEWDLVRDFSPFFFFRKINVKESESISNSPVFFERDFIIDANEYSWRGCVQ